MSTVNSTKPWDGIPGLSSQTSQKADAVNNASQMGQDTFLKLMTTQMNNQDPFNPMDSNQFLSQLAQLNTVSSLQQIQSSFSQITDNMYSNQALMGASLIGRQVLVTANTGDLAQSGSFSGAVKLDQDVSSVQITIKVASGQIVRKLDMGSQDAGQIPFSWDGLDSKGNRLPAGSYQFEATANSGQSTKSAAIVLGRQVASVTLDRSNQALMLNMTDGSSVALSQVQQIS
jgi:flagellar basal-body rod modification protein FlgD